MRAVMIAFIALCVLPQPVIAEPASALAPENSVQREIADLFAKWKASWKPAALTSVTMQCFKYDRFFERETRSLGYLQITQDGQWVLDIQPLPLAGQIVSRRGYLGTPYELQLGRKESFGWHDRNCWYVSHGTREKFIIPQPPEAKQPCVLFGFPADLSLEFALPSLLIGPGLENSSGTSIWSSGNWKIVKVTPDTIWLHGDWEPSLDYSPIRSGTWILSRFTGRTIAVRLRQNPGHEIVFTLTSPKAFPDESTFLVNWKEVCHYKNQPLRPSPSFWEWLSQFLPADALAPENRGASSL